MSYCFRMWPFKGQYTVHLIKYCHVICNSVILVQVAFWLSSPLTMLNLAYRFGSDIPCVFKTKSYSNCCFKCATNS